MLAAIGCTDPCSDLAARTCRRVGEVDQLCQQLRVIADESRYGDRQACVAGITFIDELQRSR